MKTVITRSMPRALIAAAIALAGTVASFAFTVQPVHAAPGGVYAATLAQPLGSSRREILNGVVWRCAGDSCAAPAQGGRALSECGRVARTFGEVARFAMPGGELSADDLQRCNAAR
jgi:hypothetical protein